MAYVGIRFGSGEKIRYFEPVTHACPHLASLHKFGAASRAPASAHEADDQFSSAIRALMLNP